jgi:hypothetical protein
MRQDRDLFFVAETRQLVFHVVPAPERALFYRGLFDGLMVLQDVWSDLSLPVRNSRYVVKRTIESRAATPRP